MGFPIVIATGLLLLASQFVIKYSGSSTAKLAVQTYSTCLSLSPSSTEINTANYTSCLLNLNAQVTQLIETGEINPKECEVEGGAKPVAFCHVWVWYIPRQIVLTDKAIVEDIVSRQSHSTNSDKSDRNDKQKLVDTLKSNVSSLMNLLQLPVVKPIPPTVLKPVESTAGKIKSGVTSFIGALQDKGEKLTNKLATLADAMPLTGDFTEVAEKETTSTNTENNISLRENKARAPSLFKLLKNSAEKVKKSSKTTLVKSRLDKMKTGVKSLIGQVQEPLDKHTFTILKTTEDKTKSEQQTIGTASSINVQTPIEKITKTKTSDFTATKSSNEELKSIKGKVQGLINPLKTPKNASVKDQLKSSVESLIGPNQKEMKRIKEKTATETESKEPVKSKINVTSDSGKNQDTVEEITETKMFKPDEGKSKTAQLDTKETTIIEDLQKPIENFKETVRESKVFRPLKIKSPINGLSVSETSLISPFPKMAEYVKNIPTSKTTGEKSDDHKSALLSPTGQVQEQIGNIKETTETESTLDQQKPGVTTHYIQIKKPAGKHTETKVFDPTETKLSIDDMKTILKVGKPDEKTKITLKPNEEKSSVDQQKTYETPLIGQIPKSPGKTEETTSKTTESKSALEQQKTELLTSLNGKIKKPAETITETNVKTTQSQPLYEPLKTNVSSLLEQLSKPARKITGSTISKVTQSKSETDVTPTGQFTKPVSKTAITPMSQFFKPELTLHDLMWKMQQPTVTQQQIKTTTDSNPNESEPSIDDLKTDVSSLFGQLTQTGRKAAKMFTTNTGTQGTLGTARRFYSMG